jgi:hypothetical protein
MATPFLALNVRNGTPQLRRYISGSVTSSGATFGTEDNNTGLAASSQFNAFMNMSPVVQFGGSNTLIATVGNQIYRSTNGGTSWSSVRTLTTLAATVQGAKSGIWILYSNGVPELTLVYKNSAATWYVETSPDGTTWTTRGPFTLSGAGGYPDVSIVVWGNRLAFLNGDGGSAGAGFFAYVALYDPNTHTFTSFSSPSMANVYNIGCLCVFRNRLFALVDRGSNVISIYEAVGGVLSFVVDLETTGASTPTLNARWALFASGTKMYALYWKSVALGWRCKELDSNLAATDITSSVIPPGMTIGSSSDRAGVIVDNNPNPGSAPSIYIMYATSGATSASWTTYQWNGPAALMTAIGPPGGTPGDGIPFGLGSQGATFWTADERHGEIVSNTYVAGGVRFSFKLYSAGGAETVVARLWYANQTTAYPVSACTLTNASAGVIAGNAISGLTADNSTTYLVTWNAQTDGIVAGDYAKVVLEVSLS